MKSNARRGRRAFTLFEMIVTVALISTVLISCSLGLYKTYRKEQFCRASQSLLEKIHLCRELAFLEQQIIALDLVVEREQVVCKITAEKDLPKYLEKILSKPLMGVTALASNHLQTEKVKLLFQPCLGTTVPLLVTLQQGRRGEEKTLFVDIKPRFVDRDFIPPIATDRIPPYPQDAKDETKT